MEATFVDWVVRDRYGNPLSRDLDLVEVGLPSFRSLISSVYLDAETQTDRGRRMPVRARMDMTVAEFLDLRFFVDKVGGALCTVRTAAKSCLIRAYIPGLMLEARTQLVESGEDDPMADDFTWNRLMDVCSAGNGSGAVVEELAVQLQRVIGSRRLWSFYLRDETEVLNSQLPAWEHLPVAGRMKEPVRLVGRAVHGGRVGIRVTALKSVGAWDAWDVRASLRPSDSPSREDVAVWATVYKHSHERMAELGYAEELVRGSEEQGAEEPRRFEALLSAHPQMWDRLNFESIGVIRTWERRAGSVPGDGARCLRVLLEELLTLFPSLEIVTLDAEPAQFITPRKTDPAEVLVARMDASEQLEKYIRSLDLRDSLCGGTVAVLVPRVPL